MGPLPRPAGAGGHLQEQGVQPREAMETHVKIDVREAFPNELTRPLNLSHQLRPQFGQTDLTALDA